MGVERYMINELMLRYERAKGTFIFKVKIKANSAKNEVVGLLGDGTYKFNIKAKPVDGEANNELISMLAKLFKINKNYITIKTGKTSKLKLIEIKK